MLLLVVASGLSAILSATLGMAGGMALMGVFTAEAMALHGLTQLVANGGRVVVHRNHVDRPTLGAYTAGAFVAAGLASFVRIAPPAALVYLGLGLVPFVALSLPRRRWLDAGNPVGAALAGLSVVGAQSLFGVAGPLLDTFFQSGRLDRFGVVATKAATQALSHALKVLLFVPLLARPLDLLPTALACALAAALGTIVGGAALARLPEAAFRRWTRRLVLLMGAGYLGAATVA
jgi:uncharacterized membrane protein YfcA